MVNERFKRANKYTILTWVTLKINYETSTSNFYRYFTWTNKY